MEPLLYAEINLTDFINNIYHIATVSRRPVFPVIKSNAYGTGDIEAAWAVSKLYRMNAIPMIAVVDAIEAKKILYNGFKKDILVLNGLKPVIPELLDYKNLVLSVNDLDDIKLLESFNKPVRVHIQVETGMNRLGTRDLEECKEMIKTMEANPIFTIEGMFTHFTDPVNAPHQVELFKPFTELYKFKWVHCAVSSTYESILFGNAVRGGVDMYGAENKNGLSQILTIKAKPLAIHDVNPGDTIGYSRTFTATEKGKVAVLPIGYADGYKRALQGFYMLCHGKKYTVVGRVCMNHTFLWIPDGDNSIDLNSEFIVTSKDLPLTLLAEKCGTISYEIQTGFNVIATKIYKQ